MRKNRQRRLLFARASRKIIFVFLILVNLYPVARAAGTLDPNFGDGGKVNIGFYPNSDDYIAAAALQTDGKIVLVGTSSYSVQGFGTSDFAIARLDASGKLDDTFGTNGKIIADFNGAADGAKAVAIQPDGKILVGGYSQRRDSQNQTLPGPFALVRYNKNGTLDTTFGTNGAVFTKIEPNTYDRIEELQIYPDGKILAAGNAAGSFNVFPSKIALVCYNPDGTLDAGFGNGGKFTYGFGLDTLMQDALLQSDGAIIISAGTYVRICSNPDPLICLRSVPFLLRLKPNLTVDRKFGRQHNGREHGKSSVTFNDDFFTNIVTDSTGKLFVGGKNIRRYTHAGRLEKTFDSALVAEGREIALKPDGKILTTWATGKTIGDFHVAMFDAGGELIGVDRRDLFGAQDIASHVLWQPDGKFLVLGASMVGSDFNFSLVRYLNITL